MESPAAVASAQVLGRRALSLGVANACDYAVQFLLPVLLVRCLSTADFGHYRLLWLAVGTAMAFAPMAMPASLYYFLPRADPAQRRLYVNQTILFLAAAGLVAAWAVGPWNPWLPEKMRALAAHGAVVPAFVLTWTVASLLDLLPTVDERIVWQARAIVGLAALRALALGATAIVTGALEPVLLVLLAFAACKLLLLAHYAARHHGLGTPLLRWRTLADQVRYAAPFGVSGALYELRVQADQWVAAALLPLASFASFSIAAVLAPLLTICRRSVNHAFLPSMSRLQAGGDVAGMLALNSRANALVAAFVLPLLAFVFAFAPEVVTVVYTAAYLEAAPVLRAFALALVALVIETATITLVLRQGLFVARLNAALLVLGVLVSAFGAARFGIVGAAAGSVVGSYVDRLLTLRKIAALTGMPLRRLQDWGLLARLLLGAAGAAALAWGAVEVWLTGAPPPLRLAAGATVLAAAYCALATALGAGRAWRALLQAVFRRAAHGE
jgi:O-antigen/teichoic acid export membrane protein